MKVAFRDAAAAIASECTCMRVRQTSRALSRLYDENLRPTGLQVSQLTLLVATARFGDAGANMGEMADALLLASARVVPRRLEETGYHFRYPELGGALRHLLGRP